MTDSLCLSFHRDYACQRSGACCTSGWTIPVERALFPELDEACASGRLTSNAGPDEVPLQRFPEPTADYAGLIGCDEHGTCLFFEAADVSTPQHACAVQRHLGHAALPRACQQFPRVAVLRPHSTAVSLSHYCPTAAGLLFRDGTGTWLETNAPGAGPERSLEGLDVRSALPPLLRPDVLFSWEAFDLWERFVVDVLTDRRPTIDESMALLTRTAESVRTWSLECGELVTWVAMQIRTLGATQPVETGRRSKAGGMAAYELVSSTVASGFRAEWGTLTDETWLAAAVALRRDYEGPTRRYLAARAWASWIAHESGGVRSFVRWIQTVWDLLTLALGTLVGSDSVITTTHVREAVRRCDLLLVHLASPGPLARHLARCEADA